MEREPGRHLWGAGLRALVQVVQAVRRLPLHAGGVRRRVWNVLLFGLRKIFLRGLRGQPFLRFVRAGGVRRDEHAWPLCEEHEQDCEGCARGPFPRCHACDAPMCGGCAVTPCTGCGAGCCSEQCAAAQPCAARGSQKKARVGEELGGAAGGGGGGGRGGRARVSEVSVCFRLVLEGFLLLLNTTNTLFKRPRAPLGLPTPKCAAPGARTAHPARTRSAAL